MAQAAMPGRMGGVAAERVEAPRLEARHCRRLPRAGRGVFRLDRLPVGVLPRHGVARSARTHPANAHLKRPVARAVHQPPTPLRVTRRRHESVCGCGRGKEHRRKAEHQAVPWPSALLPINGMHLPPTARGAPCPARGFRATTPCPTSRASPMLTSRSRSRA